MKKTIIILLCMVLLVAAPVMTLAASATGSLTGPGTVRAGDTITVSFNLSGSGIYGVTGTLSYDSSQVTLTKTTQKIASPWAVEFNGNSFVAYDNNLNTPINSSTTVFTATFTVKDLKAGTKLTISCNNVTASDGTADISVGSVSYTVTIAEPLSGNCNLQSLTVGNATISPAFSAGTTSYTASVPYEVSKLELSAVAADSKAKVSISNPSLVANGTTKATVTVTAENGAAKTYTISVTRAQDPNYVPSGENRLSDITVTGFLLSPVFDADVDEYLVWLPYEVENITVSGTPKDGNASVTVSGGSNLVAGEDNVVTLICTAENGDTKEYTVIAKRAVAHGSETISPTENESQQTSPNENSPSEIESDETETDTIQSADTTDDSAKEKQGIAWWWLIVVGMVALAVGSVAGYYGRDYIKKR